MVSLALYFQEEEKREKPASNECKAQCDSKYKEKYEQKCKANHTSKGQAKYIRQVWVIMDLPASIDKQ